MQRRWLNDLPFYVWQRVAEVSGESVTWREVQHYTLSGNLTSIAYGKRRCLAIADSEPYSLSHGDTDAKLKTLAIRGPKEPAHMITKQIYRLDNG